MSGLARELPAEPEGVQPGPEDAVHGRAADPLRPNERRVLQSAPRLNRLLAGRPVAAQECQETGELNNFSFCVGTDAFFG